MASLQLCLPNKKLLKLKEALSAAVTTLAKPDKRSLTKEHLQSLTGLLQYATKVVRPGRPFLQCLYALQNVGSSPKHNVRLNRVAKANILWWYLFSEK